MTLPVDILERALGSVQLARIALDALCSAGYSVSRDVNLYATITTWQEDH